MTFEIPSDKCQCGCGQSPGIATTNHPCRGVMKGDQIKYMPGHAIRGRGGCLAHLDRSAGPDACWPWTGRQYGGRGKIAQGGRRVFAYRFVYELLVGPIPEGLQLDHLCFNPICCNPAHLEPVTASVNTKRRRPYARAYKIPLTAEDRAVIRVSTEKTKVLALRYGVNPRNIRRLRQGVQV